MIQDYLKQFAETPTHFGEPPRKATLDVHRGHLERFTREHPEFTINAAKEYVLNLVNATKPSDKKQGERVAKYKSSTINHALAALDGYIQYLNDNETVSDTSLRSWQKFKDKNLKSWKRGKRNDKYLPESATVDLLNAIVQHAESCAQFNRDLTILGLILFCPCRGGEILKLRLDDVELVDSTESIPGHWRFHFRKEITKDHEEKFVRIFAGESCVGEIDIFDSFAEYLRWRKTEVSADGDLFVRIRKPYSTSATTRQNLWYGFRRAARKAGIVATPHWLRHTFGEEVQGRIDERSIRQMYGHSSETTTRCYTDHDNDETLIAAQLQAARLISRRRNPLQNLVPHQTVA